MRYVQVADSPQALYSVPDEQRERLKSVEEGGVRFAL